MSSDDYAAKNFPELTHPIVPHSMDFLVYAYLQTARDSDTEAAAGLAQIAPYRTASWYAS
jgi:uncharacterized protein YciI